MVMLMLPKEQWVYFSPTPLVSSMPMTKIANA